MAKKRKGRAIDGVLLLDKPQGLTSNAALQRVRRLFGAQKAGHTGSLDPLATGVLPICLGEATKYSRYLLDADKAYFTHASLGVKTDSGDSDGEIIEECPVPEISETALFEVLDKFKGEIDQVPSMYSALKHEGRPLYEYARKGITIDRPARRISIHRLDLLDQQPRLLHLAVECSKGTYIRSLVEDIGEAMGCGAHVSMLRRYKAGHFLLENSHTLDSLEALKESSDDQDFSRLDELLLPIDSLLPNLPKLSVNNAQSRSLLNGQAVRIAPSEKTGLARLYVEPPSALVNEGTRNALPPVFGGVVELSEDGTVQPKRIINFNIVSD